MTYVPDWLPCGHNAHWKMHDSVERGDPCPLCELKRLDLQIKEYQAALRKVDECCGCLNYGERFNKLDRGTPEVRCEDCNKEISNCECTDKKKKAACCGVCGRLEVDCKCPRGTQPDPVPINKQCWCAAKAEAKDAKCPLHD